MAHEANTKVIFMPSSSGGGMGVAIHDMDGDSQEGDENNKAMDMMTKNAMMDTVGNY